MYVHYRAPFVSLSLLDNDNSCTTDSVCFWERVSHELDTLLRDQSGPMLINPKAKGILVSSGRYQKPPTLLGFSPSQNFKGKSVAFEPPKLSWEWMLLETDLLVHSFVRTYVCLVRRRLCSCKMQRISPDRVWQRNEANSFPSKSLRLFWLAELQDLPLEKRCQLAWLFLLGTKFMLIEERKSFLVKIQ